MGHAVLLGDSIFDNERYVPDRQPVIEQVRRSLPPGWQATLLAVDGHTTDCVAEQIRQLPDSASHLFISAGGNDALGSITVLSEKVATVGDALEVLAEMGRGFREEYRRMLAAVAALGKPTSVCTIYDSIPGLPPSEKCAVALFNDTILGAAFLAGIPVIDLRLVCNHPSDYSHVSTIEPSTVGGAKIAAAIAKVATTHDFASGRSVVYW